MSHDKIPKTVAKESNLYNALEKFGTIQHYRKNDIIYLQDDPAQTFYLLKSGKVRLYFTSVEGNELTVKILQADQMFGDASYFSKTPRLTSARAVTEVELLSIDLERLLPYLSQHTDLMVELFTLMAQTIRLLSIQVYSMTFLSADKKVANLLVQLGTYFKEKEADSSYCIDYTHQELAELIGTARVTTTKVLKSFEEKGWVSLAYRKVEVLDEKALKEYVLS